MSRPLLTLLMLMTLSGCGGPPPAVDADRGLRVEQRMGVEPDPGFARALAPREFQFPEDHGAHPGFANEWWYFTGNLRSGQTNGQRTGQRTDQRRRFGYQLTLFWVGLEPGAPVDDSNWRTKQVYMGHLAISDVANCRHYSQERFSRAAVGLAGAENPPLRVWLGSWSIRAAEPGLFPLRIAADTPDFAIDLTVNQGDKPLVLQGDRGLSQKSAAPGNASYYYSYTRLPTTGTLRIADQQWTASGDSWFDREWSSSALGPDQAGWDWFALQLEDGRDLMFYRLRDRQGRAQGFSNGLLVDQTGETTPLSLQDVSLQPSAYWTSDDATRYPMAWTLSAPKQGLDLEIRAAFNDQEMRHTVRYWEGAVNVTGSHRGQGYMELSGYAR